LLLPFSYLGSKATDRVKWGLSGDYTAYHYLSQSALKSTPSFSDDSGYASNNTSSNNLGAAMAQAHSQAAQSASEAASTAAAVAAALEMMNSAHSLVSTPCSCRHTCSISNAERTRIVCA
jgi:hypothetical protein